MLNDFTGADKVYIACGYTDLRKGIDGLARLIQQQFALDPDLLTKAKILLETHSGSSRTVNLEIAKDGIYHPLEV